MTQNAYILAIDQGTSSSRAFVFDSEMNAVATAQQEFEQIYPQPGWVEHDPEAIWASVSAVVGRALDKGAIPAGALASIGITNQRETTVVWDRKTGKAVMNAIVWQDRRTAADCEALRSAGHEAMVAARTGLKLDPYFSATKLRWILDNVDGVRRRAEAGDLAFGTVDTFLVWRLTGGRAHVTDATNASRTLLFNIHEQNWDDELLELFDIPRALLPEVLDCTADFGASRVDILPDGVPVTGIAGDQQAALIGQAGFEPGMTKSTYGTGCFVIANTGEEALESGNQLLTTVAYRLGGKVTYGLEGSVFVAGSAIQWLRDELRLIDAAPDTGAIAANTGVVTDLVVVPAFAGLGAPYWDPHARGAILGLTRGSTREAIVTATLQAVALQTFDLVAAMREDGISPAVIRVDGGMVANDWFLQFLADILRTPVERPTNTESTVLGAAMLAGLASGMLDDTADIAARWTSDRVFEPAMPDALRDQLLAGWSDAVARIRGAR
ncbi:MAG: glycerol kinase GlpK [Woeseiaceae bacterium]|jgi:glycerol kinase|nr:glycerol kinase GlpK [Woeseiaceae bacterium]